MCVCLCVCFKVISLASFVKFIAFCSLSLEHYLKLSPYESKAFYVPPPFYQTPYEHFQSRYNLSTNRSAQFQPHFTKFTISIIQETKIERVRINSSKFYK
ncbi:hypothetical protein AMTRI_Chr02g260240 [Amborella trichopoda]